jgi:hypothetical protein
MSADDGEQQFDVYLPTALVRQVEHAAIDSGQSLSLFVGQALTAHLSSLQERRP